MTAAWNAPQNDADLVASFNSLSEAQAYADEYGGEVEPIGVAFAVGRGADHKRAQADFAALQRAQDSRLGPSEPAQPSGYTNAEIERIVAERVAAELAARQPAEPDAEPGEPADDGASA